MANIENLAPELLLAILRYVSHLHDLHHLLVASPAFSRVFNIAAVTIFENVLSGPYSIFPVHMQRLVRGLVFIRAGKFPLPNLNSTIELYTGVSYMATRLPKAMPIFAPGRGTLTSDIPPAILRGVVATSAHIYTVAYDCLLAYIRRVNAIRPLHCCSQYLIYGPRSPYMEDAPESMFDRPACDRNFPGLPYWPADAGPPSWVEQMRAQRALWRICIFFDLQRAGARGLLPLWPTGCLERLQKMPLLEAAKPLRHREVHGELEEIISVMEYLREVATDSGWDCEAKRCLPPLALRREETAVDWSVPLPIYDFVDNGRPYFYSDWLPRRNDHSLGRAQLIRTSVSRELGQNHNAVTLPAPGWYFYLDFSSPRNLCSPLQQCKYTPYRPLGMVFWDRYRLSVMELLHQKYAPSYDFHVFTWRSLLSKDQLAEVVTRLRRGRQPAN